MITFDSTKPYLRSCVSRSDEILKRFEFGIVGLRRLVSPRVVKHLDMDYPVEVNLYRRTEADILFPNVEYQLKSFVSSSLSIESHFHASITHNVLQANWPPHGRVVYCKHHLQICGTAKDASFNRPPARHIQTSASIALFCHHTLALICGPVLTKRAASSVKHPHVSALAANICA